MTEKTVVSNVAMIRHIERDKKHKTDNQSPTIFGMITAFIMGILGKVVYDLGELTSIVSSPQPRAKRTGFLFCAGVRGFDEAATFPVCVEDERLDDFSSDGYPVSVGTGHIVFFR